MEKHHGGSSYPKTRCNLSSWLRQQHWYIEWPWLPHEEDPYVRTEHQALIHKKVISLIILELNQWAVDLINYIMDERDANLILSIPLRQSDNDSWLWKHDKTSIYIVKSVYVAIQNTRESSLTSDNFCFWKQLWNLKVSLKVTNFIWRTLSENGVYTNFSQWMSAAFQKYKVEELKGIIMLCWSL